MQLIRKLSIPLLICLQWTNQHAAHNTNAIKDTITQTTVTVLREYEIPDNVRIRIKGKQEEFNIYMLRSYDAAKTAQTSVTPEKFLKPLANLLSPLLNLFNSPSKIILKAQVDLFASVQEPFTTYQDDSTFTIETTHSRMHNCTILAPMKHFFIVETLGNITFSSEYAAVDAYAHKIIVQAAIPFQYKNNPKDFYQHAVGTLNSLDKAHCDPAQVILRSDNGIIQVHELENKSIFVS